VVDCVEQRRRVEPPESASIPRAVAAVRRSRRASLVCIAHTRHRVYICTRVYAFCLFVLSNLSTTCVCITGVF